MIVRFFKSGTSNGEAPVRYLLSVRDHDGKLRSSVPEVLAGSPMLTISVINSINRVWKYSSGCLAFRQGENPTREELLKIIDRFKDAVAPGLANDQFNSLFVLHRDPPDPKTGSASFHVHFLFPMVVLGGKSASGKELAGRRWNPHPPGQKTIEGLALFTQLVNQDHGWAQVVEKPLRVGMDAFWRKVDNTNHRQKAKILRLELKRAVKTGVVKNRDELVAYMDQTLGLDITRTSQTTVSVKFPGSVKAMRLRGEMFQTATDFALLREASKAESAEMLSVQDYKATIVRLNQLLKEKADEFQGIGRPKRSHNRTTRKERVYGGQQHQKRLSRGHAGRQNIGRDTGLPLTKSRLERDLLQTGTGQRRVEFAERQPSNNDRPQEVANPVQHIGEASQVAAGGQQRKRGSRGATTSGVADIDQKIWALVIDLNDCEVGSLEATAILNELAILQGEKVR